MKSNGTAHAVFVARSSPLAVVQSSSGGIRRVDSNDMFSFFSDQESESCPSGHDGSMRRRVLSATRPMCTFVAESDQDSTPRLYRPQPGVRANDVHVSPLEAVGSNDKNKKSEPLNATVVWSALNMSSRSRFCSIGGGERAVPRHSDFDDLGEDDDDELEECPSMGVQVHTSAPVKIPSRENAKLTYGGCGSIVF